MERIEKYLTSRGIDLDHAAEERDKLVKKQGITEVGSWFVSSEHVKFWVLDAPSVAVYPQFEAGLQSPLMRASATEIKLVVTSEKAMHMTLADTRLSEGENQILQMIVDGNYVNIFLRIFEFLTS